MNIECAGEGLAGELILGDMWQERSCVDIDGMASGRLYDRNATQSRLIKLRNLRNDLFHFRLHTLTDDQKDFLLGTVRWLERLGNGGGDARQPQPREDS